LATIWPPQPTFFNENDGAYLSLSLIQTNGNRIAQQETLRKQSGINDSEMFSGAEAKRRTCPDEAAQFSRPEGGRWE
jgi:hypothetical protein